MQLSIAKLACIFSIFLPIASTGANARPVSVEHVDILNHGIYDGQITSTSSAPTVASGTFNWASNIRNVEVTSTIDAKLGLIFGFDFQPVGEPDGSIATVTIITIYPSPGVKNADTGKVFARDTYNLNVRLGKPTLYFYKFERAWEVVCGEWQFEVWYHGNKLAQQNFDVESPSCVIS